MKKLIISCLLSTGSITMPLLGEEGNFTIVEPEELTNERIEQIVGGSEPNSVLFLKKDKELPFVFKIQGGVLELNSEESSSTKIKALKDCYVRCVRDQFLFSDDLNQWEEPLNYFSGSFSVKLQNTDGQPEAGIIIDIDKT